MTLFAVEHVGKSYGPRDVLTDVSFTLSCHEKVAIVGANGSGKTTLLKIVAGLLQPDRGRVVFFGDGVRMGYPPQDASYSPEATVGTELTEGMRRTFPASARAWMAHRSSATDASRSKGSKGLALPTIVAVRGAARRSSLSDVESTAGTGGSLLNEGGLPHRGNVRKDEARAWKSAARSTAEEYAVAHLVHSINEAILALLGLVRPGVRDLDVSGDAAVAACDLGRPREPCRDKEGGGVGRGRRRGRTLAE